MGCRELQIEDYFRVESYQQSVISSFAKQDIKHQLGCDEFGNMVKTVDGIKMTYKLHNRLVKVTTENTEKVVRVQVLACSFKYLKRFCAWTGSVFTQ